MGNGRGVDGGAVREPGAVSVRAVFVSDTPEPSTGTNLESLHSLVEYGYLWFQCFESGCVFLVRYLLKLQVFNV